MGGNCCAQSDRGENGNHGFDTTGKDGMKEKFAFQTKTIDQLELEQIHKPSPNIAIKAVMPELPEYLRDILEKRGELKPPAQLMQRMRADIVDLPELGPFKYPDDTVYMGQYQNGLRHGKGIQFSPATRTWYEGLFESDNGRHFGRMFNLQTQDFWESEHKGGIASGIGVLLSYSTGATYTGQFQDGLPHGTGTELLPTQRYEGRFRRGVRHGMGIIEYGDGDKYEGMFVNREMHGRGQYEWSDGRVYEGEFKANQMDGSGIFLWPDGRRYVGEYRKDKKHGYGEFRFKDGRVYRGNWISGKQHGVGELTEPNGNILKGIWKDGTKIR